ncbi:MAG TPA: VOC family protein, partial [Pseudonocardiaceae bacterium]|nr:VOC family protein [Pseudonocardiaceae bacterium]
MTTEGFTTCLWFDGQAEEAANHYISIFEDSGLGRVGRY